MAFENLKHTLIIDPMLAILEPSKPYLLQIDASGLGIGTVLSQMTQDGEGKPVAFYSRKLLMREKKHAAVEQEWLAVLMHVGMQQ